MKQLLIILFILTLSNNLFAQDVIIKNSGDEINSKILEITNESIKYKEFDFQDGPIRNISISKVFMVIYENGKREKFTTQNEVKIEKQKTEEAKQEESELQMGYYPGQNRFLYRMRKYNKEGGYFSLAAGYGNSYGGYGLRAQYVTNTKLRFGIHGGAGYFPHWNGDEFLFSGGLQVFIWEHLYADAQFGTFGVSYEAYYSSYYDNSYEDYGLLIGPSLLIGYDWYWGKHIGFNLATGASLDIDSSGGIWWAIDGGVIFRF